MARMQDRKAIGSDDNPSRPGLLRFTSAFRVKVRRSLLWTAGVLALTVLLGVSQPRSLSPEALRAVRVGLLGVCAAVLSGVFWRQQVHQDHLLGLSAWPEVVEADAPYERGLLRHACQLLQARSAILVQEEGEGRISVAAWDGVRYRLLQEFQGACENLIAGVLRDASFWCELSPDGISKVHFCSPVGLQQWRGEPIQNGLVARFLAGPLISCPLRGRQVQGRLFFAADRRGTPGRLRYAEAIAEGLAERLDARRFTHSGRERAVQDERQRFSRDLHDGLLQSMTAWNLHIGDIARRVEDADPPAADRLHDIRRQIAADQRDLRGFIGRLHAGAVETVDFSLIGRLHDLRDRFAAEWGLTVEIDFSGLHALVPPALRADVCRLVHEALANAARHSQTSLVRVEVAASDSGIFLAVRDQGCGFPFAGRLDLAALRRQQQGPASLIERVTALDGELVIESSAAGASVEILLPLDQSRDRANEHAS